MAGDRLIGSKDFATASALAVVLAATFMAMSSRRSLVVTLVPGLLVTWLMFGCHYWRRVELPSLRDELITVFRWPWRGDPRIPGGSVDEPAAAHGTWPRA